MYYLLIAEPQNDFFWFYSPNSRIINSVKFINSGDTLHLAAEGEFTASHVDILSRFVTSSCPTICEHGKGIYLSVQQTLVGRKA